MSLRFQIVRYNFISQKVRNPLRIVMIADLHNQVYGRENADLLSAIGAERPDIILLPGDMIVCRKSEQKNNRVTTETIRRMTEIAPVYYAYGNHERGLLEGARETEGIWDSYSRDLESMQNLHMLVNTHEVLEPFNVCLYGLDLPREYYRRVVQKPLREDTLVSMIGSLHQEYCNILLAHNPDYFRAYCKMQPDFIVSGHNHGGMIRIPGLGGLVSPRLHPFPKYDYGVYENSDGGTKMIVTAGCGMHSIHMRINNPPEIVVMDVNKM